MGNSKGTDRKFTSKQKTLQLKLDEELAEQKRGWVAVLNEFDKLPPNDWHVRCWVKK